ncbi:MAG TPA: hypothetical protein VK569_09605 [Bacteroidota bacterium]|nr:hypothetical protein [Bacteroidota bacterium]
MKKILFLILVVTASIAMAQEAFDKYIATLRADMSADKTALMTAAMNLSGDASNKFWPVYREYDHELAKLGDRRVALIKEYAAGFDSLTDAKATSIMKGFFRNHHDRLSLLEKYYGKMEEAVGAVTAARFVQVENQIQSYVELQIASNLPLIKKVGEGKK